MKTIYNKKKIIQNYFLLILIFFILTCFGSSTKIWQKKKRKYWQKIYVLYLHVNLGSVINVDFPSIRITSLAFRSFSLFIHKKSIILTQTEDSLQIFYRWLNGRTRTATLILIEINLYSNIFQSKTILTILQTLIILQWNKRKICSSLK